MQHPLSGPRDWKSQLKGHMLGFITSTILFGTLLSANVLQCLSLLVRPFSDRRCRRFNEILAGQWWGLCVFFVERVQRVKVIFTGDHIPQEEDALVFSNHQQMPDIVILLAFAKRQKRLGQLKWFAKDIIKYVPGVGWGMSFLGCLFIKRNWTEDQFIIRKVFARLVQHRMPMWPVIFPEGTRLTAEKLKKAQEWAKKTSLFIPHHVLLPRTKGMVVTVQELGHQLKAVYDVTIAYPKGVPRMWQFLQGWCKEVHVNIQRFSIQSLPHETKELEKWAIDRFAWKDKILEHFYETGFFPTPAVKKEIV